MNIFKTFEIFLREPLSLLKDRIIQIVGVQSEGMAQPAGISAELLDKKAQITVYNSEKMYNLLRTVTYKQQIKHEEEKLKAMLGGKQVVIGQLLQRR